MKKKENKKKTKKISKNKKIPKRIRRCRFYLITLCAIEGKKLKSKLKTQASDINACCECITYERASQAGPLQQFRQGIRNKMSSGSQYGTRLYNSGTSGNYK